MTGLTPAFLLCEKVFHYLRYRLLDIYKRLFTAVVLSNLAVITWFIIKHTEPTLANVALTAIPVAVNLFVSTLFRTEYFVNLLFESVLWVPVSVPFFVRRRLAKIYQFGGVHSGAGIGCTAWAVFFCIQITRASLGDQPIGAGAMAITFAIVLLLLFVVTAAQPAFRQLQHNSFEAIHRFCGWGALILFWVLVIVLSNSVANSTGQSLAKSVFSSATFYLLAMTTLLVILP